LKWKAGVNVGTIRIKQAEKIYVPPFGKKKVRTIVDGEIIKIDSEQSLISLRGMIGRYVGLGAQSRFPRFDDPVQWITDGIPIHKVCTDTNDYIILQYNPKDRTLVIRTMYSKITASDPRYNNIVF
jgi:hypothetical protein